MDRFLLSLHCQSAFTLRYVPCEMVLSLLSIKYSRFITMKKFFCVKISLLGNVYSFAPSYLTQLLRLARGIWLSQLETRTDYSISSYCHESLFSFRSLFDTSCFIAVKSSFCHSGISNQYVGYCLLLLRLLMRVAGNIVRKVARRAIP